MARREILTPALAVVGPTASGKTALSLSLGQALGCEVVACDSMQIYRGMDIGTAKPTPAERAVLPHHMIDILPPGAPYSAADYAADALAAMRDIAARGRLPLLCGGTGLYLSALRRGGAPVASPPADPAIREALSLRAAEEGGREALYETLAAIDPEAAAATHPNNLRRVIRALEIYYKSGKTKTAWDLETQAAGDALPICCIGLLWQDRAALYARIEKRVDTMLADGLLKEAERLYAAGFLAPHTTAGQAIGYKELAAHLRGEMSLADATEALKTATRRYAKRQMTWFLADPDVHWITVDTADGTPRPLPDITREAEAIWERYLSERT